MPLLRPLSAVEQTALHLRRGIENRQWRKFMPGASKLALELGVNHKTVESALRQMEHEGLLENQGQGRRRLIVRHATMTARPLHVAFLFYDEGDNYKEHLAKIPDKLEAGGHMVTILPKTLVDLKMNIRRIASLVQHTGADAWVVFAGPREVLEWFSRQAMPVFALFGRRENLPVASIGPDYGKAHAAAVQRLARLGHRRIVLLAHRERRLPEPGLPENAFLAELRNQGLPAGKYNLPEWQETPAGLGRLVDSLFSITAPTAFIVDEPGIFLGLQQILAARGIRAPEHVSLISTETHPLFNWCVPTLSHYDWNMKLVTPRILRWASAISHGKRDTRQTWAHAEFVEGGTVGPAPLE